MTQGSRWTHRLRALAWILVAAWVGAAAMLWLAPGFVGRFVGGPSPREVGMPMAVTPAFQLTDHEGRRFSTKDLADRPYVLFFGYTHCPDICPTTLGWIAEFLDRLESVAAPLRVVFVSVDPERDQPDVLKDYLSSFDDRFIGLTGTAAEVKAVTDQWGILARKVPFAGGDYTIDHTASVLLVGADGRFRGTLDIHDETPDANVTKLRKLVGQR